MRLASDCPMIHHSNMTAAPQTAFEAKLAQIQTRVAAKREAAPSRAPWDALNPRLIAPEDDALFCEAMQLGAEWREQSNLKGL